MQQQRLVAEPLRHGQRLLDQRHPLGQRGAVVELVGQTEHHPAAVHPVLGRQPLQAAAQGGHDPFVDLTRRRRLPDGADGRRSRGAGHQPEVPEALGEVDRPAHDLDQLRPHPGPAMAVGQIHQNVVAFPRPGAGVVVHRGQRRLQQLDRALVGVHLSGLGGRGDRGAPGPVRVPGAGREPVQRQLALPSRPAGHRLGHLCVQPGPTRRRDLGVGRVPDQRVREAEPVDTVLTDQAGLLRRLQGVEHRILVETRAAASTARSNCRPITEASRSTVRVRSGSRASRRVSTSFTAVGGFASASSRPRSPRSAASRAYSTRKNGLPSVRCSSASASAPVGLDTTSRSTTSAAWSALSPVSSTATRAPGPASRPRRPAHPSAADETARC